jgi:hypothetical protein
MNYRIDKSINVIRNLTKYLRTSHAVQGSAAKDYAINRCLKGIESIQKVTTASMRRQKEAALREAWGVYLELQAFEGSERQDYNAHRSTSLDDINVDGLHEHGIVQLEVDSSSPDVRSGGLGYRSVNWKSAYFDPEHTGDSRLGSYWRPTKAKPCKVYTEEEIAGLNDGSLTFPDIEGSFEQIHS